MSRNGKVFPMIVSPKKIQSSGSKKARLFWKAWLRLFRFGGLKAQNLFLLGFEFFVGEDARVPELSQFLQLSDVIVLLRCG